MNCFPAPKSSCHSRGFSLIELLSVMAIFTVMMALVVPAITGVKSGQDVARSAYDLAGLLEQARTYAIAHNTYVWVGFFEEDGTQPSRKPAVAGNGGRIVVSVVASKDGSRYNDAVIDAQTPGAFGANTISNPVEIVPIHRLVKIDGIRMVQSTPAGSSLVRSTVPAEYQLGDPGSQNPNNSSGAFAKLESAPGGNPVTFSHPLGAASPQYTFSKIIEFSPRGEASKIAENVFSGPGPQDFMEVALQPMKGAVIDPKYAGSPVAAAAVQIEGLTGQVRIFRQ
jgi:prepilin-type N-terminal cleavage/methylation domain-containing protein